MGAMSGFSMMFPVMQTQMSSMGHGQPMTDMSPVPNMSGLQNMSSVPGGSNVQNMAYAPQFPNTPNVSNVPSFQNLTNVNQMTVPQNSSVNNNLQSGGIGQGGDNPMLLPVLLPLLQNLQLGRGRGATGSGNEG